MAPMQQYLARIFEDRAFSGSFKVKRPVLIFGCAREAMDALKLLRVREAL